LLEKEVESTNLEFDDHILFVEYEYFSWGFDINESFDEGFCVEYESFSFDPIIMDILFESSKSKFVESETFVPMTIDFDHTLKNVKIKRLVDFGPNTFPRQLVHEDKISRPMTHWLANFEYVYLFSNWAQQFDKLK